MIQNGRVLTTKWSRIPVIMRENGGVKRTVRRGCRSLFSVTPPRDQGHQQKARISIDSCYRLQTSLRKSREIRKETKALRLVFKSSIWTNGPSPPFFSGGDFLKGIFQVRKGHDSGIRAPRFEQTIRALCFEDMRVEFPRADHMPPSRSKAGDIWASDPSRSLCLRGEAPPYKGRS